MRPQLKPPFKSWLFSPGKEIKSESPSEDETAREEQNDPRPTEKEVFKCTQCGYSYLSKVSLARHVKIHRKRFGCQYCETFWTSFNDLRSHERTHTGEKPFSCSNCDYSCSQKGSLKKHYAFCIKNRPKGVIRLKFRCETCGKSYQYKNSLRLHQYSHSDRHKCDVCGKFCRSPYELSIHQLIHTGETPFGCDSCEYRAIQKSSLLRHEKICTGLKRNRPPPKTYVKPVHSQKVGGKQGSGTLDTDDSDSSEILPESPVEEEPSSKKRVMRKNVQEMIERMKQQILQQVQRASAETNGNPLKELLDPDSIKKEP